MLVQQLSTQEQPETAVFSVPRKRSDREVRERWDEIVHALKEYAPERKNTVFYYDIDDTICDLTVLWTTGWAD